MVAPHHTKICKTCSGRNSYMSGLEHRYHYEIQDKHLWEYGHRRGTAREREKSEPVRRGSRGYPIMPVKWTLSGEDNYVQSQLYAYDFQFNQKPRDVSPMSDSPLPPPLAVIGIYIDLDGKVNPIHVSELRRANPHLYPAGEKKWNDYIDRLLNFPKDKRGVIKAMWENPNIEYIRQEIDEARVRLVIWHSGSRLINPDTRKVYKSRQKLWNETVITFNLLDNITEYYFDGLYAHQTQYTPALILKDVYAATTRLQMQSCIAYKTVKDAEKYIVLGNILRGAVPGFVSNCDEFTIINKL